MKSKRRLDWVKACAANEITDAERQTALRVLREKRVALFIVTYNAEHLVESVLRRVPKDLLDGFVEVILIDDNSTDATFEVAQRLRAELGSAALNVYRTPFNRGYGGNQKLGYLYCIHKDTLACTIREEIEKHGLAASSGYSSASGASTTCGVM